MKRVESLDFLRGIAILLVLVRHIPSDFGFMSGVFLDIISKFKSVGFIGVDLFFVLSGYLVSGLFFHKINNGLEPNVSRFLCRRAFKIWPSYYIYLSVIFLIGFYNNGFSATWDAYYSTLFHFQNYILTNKVHLWSLALEEHFYTILALVIFILTRIFKKRIKPVICYTVPLLVLVPIIARIIFVDHHNLMTHIRSDGLFIGVFISAFHCFYRERFLALKAFSIPIFILAMLLLIPVFSIGTLASTEFYFRAFGILSLHLSFGLFLVVSLNANGFIIQHIFNSKIGSILQKFGILSYGIYLWHVDVGIFLDKIFNHFKFSRGSFDEIIFVGIYFLIMYLVGRLSMLLIEAPFLKLRDKFIS